MAKARRFKEKAKRAKKSEMPKKLLLVPVTLAVVGASAFGMNEYTRFNTTENMTSQIDKYELNDFSNEIFTTQDTRYLPIIYKDTDEVITKEDIIREFNKRGIQVESISSEVIGNGTQIKTPNATYTALIYGDVDGDGEVNIFDAREIVEWLLFEKENSLPKITRLAANVDEEHEDLINIFDARRIVEFILEMSPIIDSVPESDIRADKEAPVITLNPDANGNTDITIKVTDKAETYQDPLGATVTDNLDPYAKLSVDTSVVKTNVPGDYQIIYTAEDASGNKAQTVVRTVHVVDYVKDVIIEKLPTKTNYTVGQTITLDGMVAYEVKAYAGKQKDPIDLSKIEFKPTKATAEMVDKDTKVVFKYEGKEYSFSIKVKKQQPIINLNDADVKINDQGAVVVRVFDTYDVNDVVSVTDEAGNKLELGAVNKTYKKVENGKETEVSAIDTNVPGKYKIYYKTEKANDAGEYGEEVREVNIVNYIVSASDVTFEGLDSLDGQTFVDGDKITASGIKVKAKYAYGDAPVEVNVTLGFTPETVKYEKPDSTGKVTNKVKVTCKIKDEYTGEDVTYTSAEVLVNVLKQFQTIKTVGSIETSAEIYRKTKIATITSGDNEDKIDIDKLDISVTPEDTDNHKDGTESCKPEVEKKLLDNGNVEIYLKGVTTSEYRVTITPPSGTPLVLPVNMTVLDAVTSVSVEYKTLDGKPIKVGDKPGVRFKAGDTIVAELTFYHKYSGEPEALVIPNVSAGRVGNIQVFKDGTDGELIDGITVSSAENADGKVRIRIDSTENEGIESGKNSVTLNLAFTVDNQSANYAEGDEAIPDISLTDTKAKMYAADMYETSKYDVKLKGTDNKEINGIKLTVKDATAENAKDLTFGNTKVVKIGVGRNRSYYTIAKISLEDQYVAEDGIRNVLPTDINNKIVFKATKNGSDVSNDITVIGVVYDENTGTYTEAIGTEESIEYIGIKVVEDREKELEGATLEAIFKGDKAGDEERKTSIGTVAIDRRDIATIEYTDNYTPAASSYEDANLMKFISGAKENDFTKTELKNIRFEVVETGTSEDLLKGIEPESDPLKTDTDTVVNEVYRKNGKIWGGATKTLSYNTEKDKAEIDVTFWTRDAKTYSIKPKLEVNEKDVIAKTAKTLSITEETSIDKVSFNEKLTDAEITSTTNEVDFGTVRIGEIARKNIHYYHGYDSARAKQVNGGKIDYREVSQVISGNIRLTSPSTNNIASVYKMQEDGTIITKDDANSKDAIITRVRVTLKDNVVQGSTENFTLTVTNSDTDVYTANIKLTVGTKLVKNYLQVGNKSGATGTENINIYVTNGGNSSAGSITNRDGFKVKEIAGDYYTLIPVHYISTEGTKMSSEDIKGNMLTGEKYNKGVQNKIVILDNRRESSEIDESNAITFKALDEEYNDRTGEDVAISYIAIAVDKDNQDWLNNDVPSTSDWDGITSEEFEPYRLKSIKIYFTGSDLSQSTEKTFMVGKPDYTQK